jgi:hypothetical protein
MRCVPVIVAVGLAVAGCGRGEPYFGNGTPGGSIGGSTGSGTSGGATSSGGATTGSSASSGSTTGASTGSAVSGGTTGVSTAGFMPNTEVVVREVGLQGNPNGLLAIVIGDFAGGPLTCGQLFDGGGPLGPFLALELFQPDFLSGADVSFPVVPFPGSLPPPDAGFAVVLEGQGVLDAGPLLLGTGVSGVVNLTQVDVGSDVLGNFSAVMVTADGGSPLGTLSGNFDATWCGPPN